ncbi:MAG: type II secretion system F family protein [Lachnospiraceae bacterium]|nr:type II secretion system F family protein [Lachnospiraceae bacterium]
MSGLTEKMAQKLYKQMEKSRAFDFLAPLGLRSSIEFDGMEVRQYYTDKISLLIRVLAAALLLLALQGTALYLEREQVTVLTRPAAGEAAMTEELMLETEGADVTVEIYARELTWEEADESFQTLVAFLEESVLGDNADAGQVTGDLVLPDSVKGYPFTLTWSSSDRSVISAEGAVNREELTQDTVVELTLKADYGEWQWYDTFELTVLMIETDASGQYLKDVETLLQESEEASRNQEQWELPLELDGNVLHFYREMDYSNLIWIAVLGVLLPPLLWVLKDRDLMDKRRKRREVMRDAYPEFISSLSLYIAAGLNLQRALYECAADYQRTPGRIRPPGQELSDFVKRMRGGYSFYQALEAFADACDEEHYRKLAGLLRQAEKNSMRGLVQLLEQEAMNVQEEQRRNFRMKGDQMSDQLLGPMMLQLAIVMGLIMVPAFMSF